MSALGRGEQSPGQPEERLSGARRGRIYGHRIWHLDATWPKQWPNVYCFISRTLIWTKLKSQTLGVRERCCGHLNVAIDHSSRVELPPPLPNRNLVILWRLIIAHEYLIFCTSSWSRLAPESWGVISVSSLGFRWRATGEFARKQQFWTN